MQGVAWGGRGLGSAFGAIIIGLMSISTDWSVIVLLIGLLAVVQCLAGMLIKEPKVTTERIASFGAYKKVAKRRETWTGLAYILLASTALLVSEVFGTTYLKEQAQADTTTLGIALAVMSAGIFLGSLPMGIIPDKVGTKKALLTGNVLAVVGCGLLATVGPNNVTWMLSAAFMTGAFQGAQMTAMLRMYMELSPPEIGGSMFALYSSVSNAGISVLASLTFYFVAPRLGNASGVLSVIPYAAVATLMIPFMTLYKPAKKEPTQRQVIRNAL
jgi:predicted MFS family arabinose efflux permease